MNIRIFALATIVALAPALTPAQDQSLIFAQADYPDPGSAEAAIDSSISADATELALLKDVFAHIELTRGERSHVAELAATIL